MANGTFRITRGRGNAQLPLAIVAVLAIALVVLGRAQSGLFDRARAGITDWMSPALDLLHTPVEQANKWASDLGNIFSVYQENVRLRDENARLRRWQTAATLMDERVKRYQLLLHAVPDPALQSIVARVIGRASRPFDQTMILDAGKRNSVKPGQAVVDARGMVGRIFLAGDHTSWVVLLTDLNSRIPVTIKPGNAQAILTGDNSAIPRLADFSQNAQLKAGDSIVTSGDGGLLPPGLPIGTLVDTGSGLRVVLLADPQSVDDVEVLDYKAAIENIPAASAGDLPITAAGLPPAAPPQDDVTNPPPLPALQLKPAGAAQSPPSTPPQTTTAAAKVGTIVLKPPAPSVAAAKPQADSTDGTSPEQDQ